MRGNPLLRSILLVIALGLTSAMVASLLGGSRQPSVTPEPPAASPSAPPGLLSTFINITLSSPAASLTFVEPSGRVIAIPAGDSRSLVHLADLAIDPSTATWEARLSIEWQDPAGHHFARLELEPHQLETATLVLDFPGNVTNLPLTATFRNNPEP